MTRERLSNRRASLFFDFQSMGMPFTASISHYPDGRISELFCDNHKCGSAIGTLVRDVRGEACLNCGYMPKPPARAVDVIDADLVELGVAQRAAFERRRFYLELRGYQQTAHKRDGTPYARGWAANQFKSKFGAYPPWHWNDEPPLDPPPETRRWIRSRQIAWLRARNAG